MCVLNYQKKARSLNLYKTLRKNKDGVIEVFYTDHLNLQEKKLLDAERKKSRALKSAVINEANKKSDLQQRQKLASELRKIKMVKKEALP